MNNRFALTTRILRRFALAALVVSGFLKSHAQSLPEFTFSVVPFDDYFVSIPVLAPGSTAARPIPSQFFGIHVNSAADLSTLSLPAATIRLWDDNTDWFSICPNSATTCDWSTLDAYLSYASSHDLDVIYTFGRVPIWENPSGPTYQNLWATNVANMTDWTNFVSQVVQRSNGRIKYWEIWNEPDNPAFWSGTNAQLVALAQSAYNIIKSADPSSKILLPPTAEDSNWTNAYLASGGGAYADIMTLHGYPYTSPEEYLSTVSAYQSVFTANGYAQLPIWDTEGNWVNGDALTYGGLHGANADEDAAWVARSMVIQASMGVAKFAWYGWDYCDASPCYANLWTPSLGLLEPGTAYATTAKWLTGAFVGACTNVSGTVWACPLARDGGYLAQMMWDTSNTSSSFTVGSQYVQSRDLITNQGQTIEGNTIILGHRPLLIETRSVF